MLAAYFYLLLQGLLMAFLTQLKIEHHPLIAAMIQQHLNIPDSCINAGITRPRHTAKHVQVSEYTAYNYAGFISLIG